MAAELFDASEWATVCQLLDNAVYPKVDSTHLFVAKYPACDDEPELVARPLKTGGVILGYTCCSVPRPPGMDQGLKLIVHWYGPVPYMPALYTLRRWSDTRRTVHDLVRRILHYASAEPVPSAPVRVDINELQRLCTGMQDGDR